MFWKVGNLEYREYEKILVKQVTVATKKLI